MVLLQLTTTTYWRKIATLKMGIYCSVVPKLQEEVNMIKEKRPNPNEILKQLAQDENEKQRGKLKIFFGYAAGVGKTYAMLQAAHDAKEAGIDVVAGYIEPHMRQETIELLEGLEIIEPLKIDHKGIILKEFDLDSAIKRKPEIILVDELAHSNAPGSRHLKRYQDIEELLKTGIDVYTTINVQHIESLNDIVAAITGIIVRERIPDKVFDQADQVELVDIEPDDLIERLNKGKIYKTQQVQNALSNFFVKENLVALREIALRRTADQVNKVVERTKAFTHNNEYYTGEHILICLSSSPSNAKVIRTASRLVKAFHGHFTALFVETCENKETLDDDNKTLKANLKLAEQLGAKIATVYGDDVPEQIAEYAKASGVSKIVIGRSNNKRGLLPKTSLVERLTLLAPNVDVYIIPDNLPSFHPRRPKTNKQASMLSIADAAKAVVILILATVISFGFYNVGFTEANIINVYILGVLVTAVCTKGKLYSSISSIVSVLVFNFFFTEPRFSFQAYDNTYPVTFIVMFLAAFLTSTLAMRVKEQAHQAALKAHSTEVLLETSQKLQRAENRSQIYKEMAHQMRKLLDRTIIIYPVSSEQTLGEPMLFPRLYTNIAMDIINSYINGDERAVAQWVYKNNKNAGATTNTLPGAKCLYLAVRSHDTVFAVVAIAMDNNPRIDTFEKNLLIAMLGEFGLALEKEQINETKNEISMQVQREQLRGNLLRAISHDLRTPLTSISGNAGILMANSEMLDNGKKLQLYTDIYDDSMWLINLVENLLSVTRIENGTMNIPMQAELLDDVISEALRHINRRSVEHHIAVNLEHELLMAKMDSRLIIQVIINIIDNAIKYTQPGSHINISAKKSGDKILVEISDDGDGISDIAKEKLFDMFFTMDNNKGDSRRGLGLGLSLCKSIIIAHGGMISVKDNIPHGTVICFTLQAEEVKYNE